MITRSSLAAAAAAAFVLAGAQHASAVVNNVALGGKVATQSSTASGGVPERAVDGNTNGNWAGNSVTHTDSIHTTPWWRVDLGATIPVSQVNLFNRTDCCGGRLSDITVNFYAADGTTLVATSPEFNNNNGGSNNPHTTPGNFTFTPAIPSLARYVEVVRNSTIFGDGNDRIISLAEVQVLADNLAQGKPATQSSEYPGYPAGNAVDGNLGNFTHTASANVNPSLTVDLQGNFNVDSVILHNRDDCCGGRLRDITVELLAVDGVTVVASSGLLNPGNDNQLPTDFNGSFTAGPAFLAVDFEAMFPNDVHGRFIRVTRTSTPGGGDNNNVLSLGELQVFGTAMPEPMTATLGLMALATLATRTGRRSRA